jgi:hypothetical protein
MKKKPKKQTMPVTVNRRADFTVSGHGSLYLLEPHTDAAKAWLNKQVHHGPYQWFGNALAIEHRYIGEIVQILQDEGFVVV